MNTAPIIAIVGAPRTGKSYLAKRLAQAMNATLFLEDNGEGYPERMQENLEKNIRPLERQLWFRNKCIERHLNAKELQRQGIPSVLDIFWLSAHLYIDAVLEGFERDLMRAVSEQDEILLGYPDVIVYLKQSEAGTRSFIQRGGRTFDASEQYYKEVVHPANELHETYFNEHHKEKCPVIMIDRTGIDFSDTNTLNQLLSQIQHETS